MERRGVTLEHLRLLYQDSLFRNINRRIKHLVHDQPLATPFIHSIVSTYCDESGNILGHCAVSTKRKINAADIELMNWVIAALESAGHKKHPKQGNQYSEIVLRAVLNQEKMNSEDISILYSVQGWKEESWLCMGIISVSADTDASDLPVENLLTFLRSQLNSILPGTIVVRLENTLVFCLSLKDKNVAVCDSFLREKMERILKIQNCVMGVSLPFRQFQEGLSFFRQAQNALNYNRRNGSSFSSFAAIAMDSLLSCSDPHYLLSCIHPAVLLLNEYDQKYHGELGRTLWLYLRLNQSYAAAAKELHIHRNTVLYRLERIWEIYPLDYQDPDLVEYLLCSFRLQRLQDETILPKTT